MAVTTRGGQKRKSTQSISSSSTKKVDDAEASSSSSSSKKLSGKKSHPFFGDREYLRSMTNKEDLVYAKHIRESDNAEPKLHKVVKANSQLSNKAKYYVTFEAKDAADHDQVKTYQALIFLGFKGFEGVDFCRLKPTPTGPSVL